MKIAEKLKYLIAHDDNVIRRRALLRALFYLQQKHPKKCYFRVVGGNFTTSVDLMVKDFFDRSDDYSGGNVTMPPLSSYPNYSDK